MPHQPDQLDREGCEYGRRLALRFDFFAEKVDEIAHDVKDIKKDVARIQQRLTITEVKYGAISAIIASIIAGGRHIISWLRGE